MSARRDPNNDEDQCLACAGLGRLKVDPAAKEAYDRWGPCPTCAGSGLRAPHVHSFTTCAVDAEGPTLWWLCGFAPQFTLPAERA